MTTKKCDICNEECSKTYDMTLQDGNNDIKIEGKIDLCPTCANKIKQSLSNIEDEV